MYVAADLTGIFSHAAPEIIFDAAGGTGFNFLLAGDMPSYIHDVGLLSPTAKER